MPTIELGTILDSERLAYQEQGFVCPLKHGDPNRLWCVMATKGDHVLLVPVSEKRLNDDDREGVLLFPEPVIVEDGLRNYLCLGYRVPRFVQEIIPPGSCGGGFGPKVMPDSFARALTKMGRWNPPDTPAPDFNWWALYYTKGELSNHSGNGSDAWANLTVANLLETLHLFDPMVEGPDPDAQADAITTSIRKWLLCHPLDTKAINLV